MWELRVTEWIAILSFIGGIVFGLMKFHSLFTRLDISVDKLNDLITTLRTKFDDHETRITRLEEQNKTLFKNQERKK